MKTLIPLGLVATVIFTLVAVGPAATVADAAQGAGLVSSVLNRLEQNRRSLRSLRSGISMEKYNSQLHDSDKYTGKVLYVPAAGRNANVRIEWQSPQHEVFTVSNGAYTLCRPRLNTCYTGKTAAKQGSNANSVLQFLSMSGAQLKAKFDVQDARDETVWPNISAVHLTLVPKGAASFKYAEVWIDGSGMPVQSKVVEKNDDATTVRLGDIERNVDIPSDQFKPAIDKGVKVIPA
jgi:outer membrane lipoprotein-sorting protein